ncbi:MAG: hypothetical protein RSE41_00070 [Clostridia bacterium]
MNNLSPLQGYKNKKTLHEMVEQHKIAKSMIEESESFYINFLGQYILPLHKLVKQTSNILFLDCYKHNKKYILRCMPPLNPQKGTMVTYYYISEDPIVELYDYRIDFNDKTFDKKLSDDELLELQQTTYKKEINILKKLCKESKNSYLYNIFLYIIYENKLHFVCSSNDLKKAKVNFDDKKNQLVINIKYESKYKEFATPGWLPYIIETYKSEIRIDINTNKICYFNSSVKKESKKVEQY